MNTESSAHTAGTSTKSSSPPLPSAPDRVAVKPLSIESADEEFEFYHQWSLEERKRSIALVNDGLRHLTTLVGGLLGGAITFLGPYVHPLGQASTVFLLLIALVVGLVGIMPYTVLTPVNQPTRFRKEQERATGFKIILLRSMALLLFAAFIVAILGAMAIHVKTS